MAGIPPCVQPPRSDALKLCDRPFVDKVPGIQSRSWLVQHDLHFFISGRAVLDAVRHDDELAFPDNRLVIPKLHPQRAFDHQKHFVFVFMVVPDEFALELRRLHIEVVELPDDLGLQRSEKLLNLSARLMVFMTSPHALAAKDCERFVLRSRERAALFLVYRFRNKCAGRFPSLTPAPSPSPLRRDKV